MEFVTGSSAEAGAAVCKELHKHTERTQTKGIGVGGVRRAEGRGWEEQERHGEGKRLVLRPLAYSG